MNRKSHPPATTPAAKGDLVPDTDIMFPALNPDLVEKTADAAVGIKDPRTEGNSPEVVSTPFADR